MKIAAYNDINIRSICDMGCISKSLQNLSYSLFCRKKINRRLVKIRRNWDEISKAICGHGNHKG